jgi:hypothetical protein
MAPLPNENAPVSEGGAKIEPEDARQGQKTVYMRRVLPISVGLSAVAVIAVWVSIASSSHHETQPTQALQPKPPQGSNMPAARAGNGSALLSATHN